MDDRRQPERRRHRRAATDTRVDVIFADHTSDAGARARNLSESGLFLAADELFSAGTQLGVGLRPLPERAPIRALVEVVWTRPTAAGAERPRGMGVRLVEIDEAGVACLHALVAGAEVGGAAPEQGDESDGQDGQLPLDFFAGGVAAERVTGDVARGGEREEAVPTTLSAEVRGRVPFTLTFEDEGSDAAGEDAAATRRVGLQLSIAAAGLAIVAMVLWILWPRGGERPPVPTQGVGLPARTPVYAAVPPAQEMPALPSPVPTSLPTPEPIPATDGELGAPEPTEVVALAPTSEGEGLPSAVGPVSTAVVLGGASKVVNVSWREEGGAELLTVRGNHPLARQQVLVQVLPGPARCLIRLSGIEEPFSRDRLRVGMALIRGVRIGWHRESSPRELHLVLDLASDAVQLESTIVDDTLTVRLAPR